MSTKFVAGFLACSFTQEALGRDSRHEDIIECKKTSKAIICYYLGTRIRKKVIGFPFVDIETNSRDMTAFQGTSCLDQNCINGLKRPDTHRIKA